MSNEIYKLPFPSTALVEGVRFEKSLGRVCLLRYEFENADGTTTPERISFEGVEAFRCTYHTACDLEMFEASDRVVDLGSTRWLGQVQSNMNENGDQKRADGLKHMRIFFDDGRATSSFVGQ